MAAKNANFTNNEPKEETNSTKNAK